MNETPLITISTNDNTFKVNPESGNVVSSSNPRPTAYGKGGNMFYTDQEKVNKAINNALKKG